MCSMHMPACGWNMTWIKRLLLACRRLALQPLHCRNILDRIRHNNLYVDPKGRFGVSFSCCFIMQKHAQLDAIFHKPCSSWTAHAIRLAYHRIYVLIFWMWRIAESMLWSTQLYPLIVTRVLYCVQALRRRARATSARLEPIRLGQVSHISEGHANIANSRS